MTSQKQRNLEAMFEIFDVGGDGYLSAADFAAHAESTCGALRLPAGSPHWTTIHAALDAWWEHLLRHSDGTTAVATGPAIPTVDCVTVMENKLVDDEVFFAATVGPIADTVFRVLDADGDDSISTEEYVAVYLASGLSRDIAVDAFAKIDTNGDGRIDRGEFVAVVRDAFTSNDPDSPGAWFFGVRPDQ
ncbi:EF-hand domain-containing protein [Actinokineospora diospyrosa]|uniref:Ca2+-binding protein, EF-hand superfamily n=1 Tax=Actinokineospora diospyrosa TaxID=103728 RepID=A0ABT1IN47_9PSEU|nr:EF-hand domain-containing protein [Actinokineospora diospyrosa]MCP2274090.1 Ca2+-binding protein, EF-hand superfamily [Actinokineospora diospyrosa]